MELYNNQKGNKKLDDLYKPLLEWCKSIDTKISQPTLLNIDTKNFVVKDISSLELEFSESMDTTKPFQIQVVEFDSGKETGNQSFVEIKNANWKNDAQKVNFKIDTPFKEFALVFNWWGINEPLFSKSQILLQPSSYILIKK